MAKQETKSTEVTFKSVKPKSAVKYINPKELFDNGTTGVIAQGRFLGRADKNQFGKSDFKIESTTERAEDGSPVLIIINESGNLAFRMSVIQVGDLVRISYKGKEKIASGQWAGKRSHQFEVEKGD